MLLRSVNAKCPEAQLVVAGISQAIADCALASGCEKAAALRFMRDWRLNAWARAVGLDPDFVREVAVRTQYLEERALALNVRSMPVCNGLSIPAQMQCERNFDA